MGKKSGSGSRKNNPDPQHWNIQWKNAGPGWSWLSSCEHGESGLDGSLPLLQLLQLLHQAAALQDQGAAKLSPLQHAIGHFWYAKRVKSKIAHLKNSDLNTFLAKTQVKP
jgi:hypothetical protein